MGATGVFISHHSNSSQTLVKELSAVLTAFEIDHWYAERDIKAGDNYTYVIPEVIKQSELIILLLNKEANASDQVLREVQYALKWKIPLIIARLDDCEESQSIAYIGSTAQYLDLRGLNKVMAAQHMGEVIRAWKNETESSISSRFQAERAENTLDFYGDEGERDRLKVQRGFVYDFAAKHYDNIISEYKDASFLDIGCNTGEQAMMFVSGRTEVKNYIGVDHEKKALERGKELFPDGHFYLGNCESDDFDDLLSDIEDELGIDGFDIINISMVLLHIKEPQLLLDVLSEHLAEGGKFIILDIDDGLSIAYPDPENLFEKAVELCAETEYSGYRKSGRQILRFLCDVDRANVELLDQGLSTAGMSRDKRADLFDLYFWFILDDLRKMHHDVPNDKIIETQLRWIEEHYKDMKSKFKKKSFFFNVGFMLFSAQ